MTPYLPLAAFLAVTFIAGLSGGYFRPGEFYASLSKPSWNPPDWVFAPAWMVLYIFIAVGGWLVWTKEGYGATFIVWCVQIVLNTLWSYLAFGINRLDLAFYELILLWLSIAAFILLAWQIDQTAAYLFVPYLMWVTFAGVLNFTVWQMNIRRVRA